MSARFEIERLQPGPPSAENVMELQREKIRYRSRVDSTIQQVTLSNETLKELKHLLISLTMTRNKKAGYKKYFFSFRYFPRYHTDLWLNVKCEIPALRGEGTEERSFMVNISFLHDDERPEVKES